MISCSVVLLVKGNKLVVRALTSQVFFALIAMAVVLTGFSRTASAEDFEVQEVAGGLYLHQGRHEQGSAGNLGDIGNSGFIIGSEGVAVIDPGGSIRIARMLHKVLREQTDLPIMYLILTHFHPDHVAGADVFSEAEHVVAHVNYPRALTQRAGFYLERFPWLLAGGSRDHFVQPDLLVEDQLLVDLGDRELFLTAHPTAHTDNDLTVHDRNTNILWAADLVFSTRAPALDGNLNGWIALLQELDEHDYDAVVPGHGSFSDWSSAMSPLLHYLETLRESVRKQIADGVGLADAIRHETADRDSRWMLIDQQHPVNVTKAYTELEWE